MSSHEVEAAGGHQHVQIAVAVEVGQLHVGRLPHLARAAVVGEEQEMEAARSKHQAASAAVAAVASSSARQTWNWTPPIALQPYDQPPSAVNPTGPPGSAGPCTGRSIGGTRDDAADVVQVRVDGPGAPARRAASTSAHRWPITGISVASSRSNGDQTREWPARALYYFLKIVGSDADVGHGAFTDTSGPTGPMRIRAKPSQHDGTGRHQQQAAAQR